MNNGRLTNTVEQVVFWRQCRSDHLQAVPLSFVLILAIQLLHFCVLDKRIVDILATLHVQLQIHVALLPCALVIHIDALHKVMCVAFKQTIDSPLNCGVLKADTSNHTRRTSFHNGAPY